MSYLGIQEPGRNFYLFIFQDSGRMNDSRDSAIIILCYAVNYAIRSLNKFTKWFIIEFRYFASNSEDLLFFCKIIYCNIFNYSSLVAGTRFNTSFTLLCVSSTVVPRLFTPGASEIYPIQPYSIFLIIAVNVFSINLTLWHTPKINLPRALA